MNVPALLVAPAVLLGLALAAPAHAGDSAQTKHTRTVELSVTSDGFVPAEVTVKRGETVKLVVTRKVERTCATEIVMKDFGINQPLPFEKAVAVTVKPKKAGDYRFACGMDMIAGVLRVD
ncbi:MAG TPA: cupredoxin domain-containing protein [Anaeromyxobacteraceae bacterium]